jgi:putative phosphoesterase
MPDLTPRTDRVQAKRIAFLSDTHFMKPRAADVPRALTKALAGSDLIVHLGHISSVASLDRLAKTAPVLAVRTALDDQLLGDALAGEINSGRVASYVRVIESAGLRIGCVHDLSMLRSGVKCSAEGRMSFAPRHDLLLRLASTFGGPVDIVAFANTHIEVIAHGDGVLFLNPGSPNLPGGARAKGPGTIARAEIARGAAQVDLVEVNCR